MGSRSQMVKQNFQACTVAAKMLNIKGRSIAWQNLGKELDRIRVQNPKRPRKGIG